MTKYTNTGNKDTRSGFGEGLLAAGRECKDVVALAADLKGSVKMDGFAKEFPDRFFQCGIAEANMINVAAGLSLNGKIPFVGTFAAFAAGRVYDQVRMAVCYSETNVKIAASHAGITLGEDGATHQILEDIGLMRMLPGISVVVPCDFNQTKNATIAAAKWNGPVYLRFGRPSVPNFTPENEAFEIGKAYKLNDGKDVTILACGHLVWEALLAAEELEKEGVTADVINVATIKPLDYDTILESIKKTGCVVTAEEHFIFGGMGEMIAGLLASHLPAPLEFVAIADKFGQSGTPAELMKAYGLDAEHIVAAARRAVSRK
ncbi:MAG: transketolase family protein [Bacteroidales bacterium]|nr:transketolase family protein [Bacteroidales bacterium]